MKTISDAAYGATRPRTSIPTPRLRRRSLFIGLAAVPVAVSVVALLRRHAPTIADGVAVRPDPAITRSCQAFIDMLGLRGVATRARSANSLSVDAAGWQRLAPVERQALANAVACRAFGKQARQLAIGEAAYVHLRDGDRLVATASSAGVILAS